MQRREAAPLQSPGALRENASSTNCRADPSLLINALCTAAVRYMLAVRSGRGDWLEGTGKQADEQEHIHDARTTCREMM